MAAKSEGRSPPCSWMQSETLAVLNHSWFSNDSSSASGLFCDRICIFCSASVSACWQVRVSTTPRSNDFSDSSSDSSPRSMVSTSVSSSARACSNDGVLLVVFAIGFTYLFGKDKTTLMRVYGQYFQVGIQRPSRLIAAVGVNSTGFFSLW